MPIQRTIDIHPSELEVGQKVRLYIGHLTDTEIYIREGKVVAQLKNRRWGTGTLDWRETTEQAGPAVQLRVERIGKLIRGEPREISVENSTGYQVKGHPETSLPKRPYLNSYFYHCISGIELI